jgi:hypothetical protein
MRPKLGLLMAAIAAAALLVVPVASARTQTSAVSPATTQQVVGTAGNLAYDLTATVTRIVDSNGSLQAVGELTGTVTNTVTGAVQTVDQTLGAPVTQVTSVLGGSSVSISLGGANVTALGTSVALSPIQVSLDSGIVSGVLDQIEGLLGGLTGGLLPLSVLGLP